jgi:Na+-driven multidrug efflux pump
MSIAPAALLSPADRLTQGPVLPVMLSLALPNMVAMLSAAAVSIAETAYVGALGREPLAGIALVFPFVMLMQTVSGGAMGGAISAAVSRALGANRDDAARSLALHAAVIGLVGGVLFLVVFTLFGPALCHLVGARDTVLQQAPIYSNVLFLGAPLTWLNNSLVPVVRGSGNIRFSAMLIVGATMIQVVLGAGLGLGLGPFRAGAWPAWHSARCWRPAQPRWRCCCTCARHCRVCNWRGAACELKRESFAQILRIGLLAALSPVQNVLTVLVLTGLVARLGVDALAGYGIGARLEFLPLPLSFGVGVTLVPMGHGRRPRRRARAAASPGPAALCGGGGGNDRPVGLHLAARLGVVVHRPAAGACARRAVPALGGPGFAFYGLGITLYFASQGAGQVLGPVLGATMRLAVVALGGAALSQAQAPAWTYFALVAAAMLAYGLFNAAALARTDWRRAVAPSQHKR